jgi:hypothetical protein
MTRKVLPRALAALVGAGALAAAGGGVAGADDPLPEPTSCAGVAVTDPAGDSHLTTGGGGAGPGQANLDVQRAFFRYAPDATGANVLTANIEITKLDMTLPAGAQAIAWNMNFTLDGTTRYVQAKVGSDGKPVFDHGVRASPSTSEGETTGRLIGTDKGIVQIVIPVDKLKGAGKTFSDVYATAGYVEGPGPSLTVFQDRAPDGTAYGKSFKATPCAQAGTPTPVQDGAQGGTGPGTTPGGGGQAGGGGGGAPAAQGPATLQLKVVAGKLSAKKIAKKRAFTVGLDAGERITGLKAKLAKGSKALGTGSLAAVGPGRGSLQIKLAKPAATKLRRGTYTLAFTGTKADGRTASGSVQVRIAK